MEFLFDDYTKTKRVYHVVSLKDLGYVIENGISYDDKITYITKYKGFHDYIEELKTDKIPSWVDRKKSIFASLNFSKDHYFHSHSALLSLKINEDKCWIANENLANEIYEPFALKDIKGFEYCKKYLDTKAKDVITRYWDTSLSFKDNLKVRRDLSECYDAEILIADNIPKEDIEVIKIYSDHNAFSLDEFRKYFTI
ncbi:hypothetical protein [Tepidibacter aestuarii]|uniref:hypothetical protein n=1 Tax=Tepidibacter aestuarii TaxID=2925782 RepID=UPI0020BE76D7|nr:hypothetical protein [Tepidibacter aestuarii]CAH2214713.1 conserved protein of unknown function [Tepidibacter aestuarii]